MARTEDLDRVRDLMALATTAITSEYFILPVATEVGAESLEQYRERVYSYELYHQLRKRWPADWPYTLGGEVDKTGHPIVRGNQLDNVKPDLLIHGPGTMDHNLTVIEIKPAGSSKKRIKEDIEKLIAFRNMDKGYASAIMLIFGETADRIRECGATFRDSGMDLSLVELICHRQSGEAASTVRW